MRGLRIQITGSAAPACDGDLLRSAKYFIQSFVGESISHGAGLVLGAGGEPLADSGDPCIFDWTALEIVAAAPDPAPEWPTLRRERFVVVASQRAIEKVPHWRMAVWDKCRRRSDFDLVVTPAGWKMGGIIRQEQELRGDVLLALGGGAGTEHLCQLYQDNRKAVIPINADLGAISSDGRGGSRYLHERALADAGSFVTLLETAGSASARLSALRLTCASDPASVANEALSLITAVQPPRAFYVRLLDSHQAAFHSVERFFRKVVDPVVTSRGFTPHEMGAGRPEAAFINVEIFEVLHRAGLVVVDLTGVRPNCMMELGYALGRRRRLVLSARADTKLPFDGDRLPIFLWEEKTSTATQINAFRDWLDRNIDMPPLVP